MLSTREKQLIQEALRETGKLIKGGEPLNKRDFSNEDLEVLYATAHRLYEAKDFIRAKEIFHQLIMSKPLHQKYWLGLAACMQLEKRFEEALRVWGVASIIDGDDPMPHFHAAECFVALKDFDQALKALEASKALVTTKHRALEEKILCFENKWKILR